MVIEDTITFNARRGKFKSRIPERIVGFVNRFTLERIVISFDMEKTLSCDVCDFYMACFCLVCLFFFSRFILLVTFRFVRGVAEAENGISSDSRVNEMHNWRREDVWNFLSCFFLLVRNMINLRLETCLLFWKFIRSFVTSF